MSDWYIKLRNETVFGPFVEHQIRQGLEAGRITSKMLIRQDDSPWTDANRVREMFMKLDDTGFYIRNETGSVFGPFTKDRILEMDADGELPPVYGLRQGTRNEWAVIDSSRSRPFNLTFSRRKTSAPSSTPAAAAKTEQSDLPVDEDPTAKPVVPAAPVMRLRGHTLYHRLLNVIERCEYALLGDPMTNR